MNVVLFLGAGFSKPFGLPVMAEFFEYALGDRSPLDGRERQLVQDLRRRVRDSASMLDADENNLEDLLSVSLFTDEDWPGGTSEELLACLWKVYRRPDPRLCLSRERNLKRLVRFDQIDSHHHTIITTNYDIVAEYAFLQIGRPLGIPGKWEPTAGKLSDHHLYNNPQRSTRIICKLHGSVSWTTRPQDPLLLLVDGRMRSERNWQPGEPETLGQLPNVSANKMLLPGCTPLIVPPTLYKGSYPACFNPIWRAARDALRKADRVAFVGYSFPPSDTHMTYFLACSLAASLTLRSIDIVDPHATEICDRLRSDGARMGATFKQKLRAFDGKWEENGYDILSA